MNNSIRKFRSNDYNFNFNTLTGLMLRWGNSFDKDPLYSPYGPEILDLEVSTVCSKNCKWCYKSNTTKGKNMSFETFKIVLDKIPNILTQIAFGIGDLDGNKDLFKMFEYAKSKNIIPNLTINGENLTDYYLDKLSEYCGAVAVSLYDKDKCYSAVEKLSNRNLQANIHVLISEITYKTCLSVIKDVKTDKRLDKLNAIIFLSLKQKGRGKDLKSITLEQYQNLLNFALESNINFGFDSCTAPHFLYSVKDNKDFEKHVKYSEPCESGLFSSYINVDGDFYPCSFVERTENWVNGISVVNSNDFLKDIWFNDRVIEWRKELLESTKNCKECKVQEYCRICPVYDIVFCKGVK